MAISLCACTTTGDLYTFGKYQDFDTGETVKGVATTAVVTVAAVVIVGVVVLAAAGSGGNGSSSTKTVYCRGLYCDESAAWDYLSGSGEYRCRDTSNGQFTYDYNCANQSKMDNWY